MEIRDKAYIGIDPGKSGAMALIAPGIQEIFDWTDGPTMANYLMFWKSVYNVKMTAVEKVHAMPKQGVVSTFNFGANYGWWIGALDAFSLRFIEVSPRDWQKGIVPRKKTPSDKPSLEVARRLFPDAELHLKKHHGRADALLIADWLRRRENGGR